MKRIAIVINTQYGQTEKIAQRLRDKFVVSGMDAEIFKVVKPRDTVAIDLDRFDTVIVGAPVYAGKFSKHLTRWAKAFAKALHTKTCAVFTVSGNAADKRPSARPADDAQLALLVKE